jgi:hypothetical protein
MNAATSTLAVEAYRHQLAETADHISAATAHAALSADPAELETLSIRLNGVARLALRLRTAILIEGAQVSE